MRVQGQGHCTALSQLGQQRSHSANMPCGIFLKILPLILSRALASNVKIGIKHKGGKGKPFDRQNRRGVPTIRRSLPSPHVTGRPLSLMGLCRSSLCTRSRTEASSAQHTEVCNSSCSRSVTRVRPLSYPGPPGTYPGLENRGGIYRQYSSIIRTAGWLDSV